MTFNQAHTLPNRWMNILLGFLLFVTRFLSCQALVSPPAIRNAARVGIMNPLFSDASSNGIQTVDLGSLGDDHEKQGQLMADSIVRWLDVEWFPQKVHIDMADQAKQSYIKCRENNQNDVMDIMMQISNDLHADWAKYNDDAFINAWDIGNYCSDYLVKQSGNEGCECASEIF